jgi:hypothetical protein
MLRGAMGLGVPVAPVTPNGLVTVLDERTADTTVRVRPRGVEPKTPTGG